MKNQNPHLSFLFFSTLMAILIWMASPSVKGYVKDTVYAKHSNTFPLAEYEARYAVSWHGLHTGESVHKLYRNPNGNYHLETRTDPKMRFLPFHYVESSDFSWENGKILPQHYYYNIQEGKRHKKGNVEFDWKSNKLSNKDIPEKWEENLSEGIQDKLTQTLCLRTALKNGQQNLAFTVAEDDKIRNYSFAILGEERIQTNLGSLDTIKVQHISRKGHRTTTWFAKNLDFVPVKMTQMRQGKVVATGEILSIKHS